MNKSVISLLLLVGMAACSRMGPKEINIIPKGYVGKVAIVFDQKNGVEEEYMGDRRVYRIPECGILRTKFSDPGSVIYNTSTMKDDILFVYTDKHGHITDTMPLLLFSRDDSNKRKTFFKKNVGKLIISGYGRYNFSFHDTEHYNNIEAYIVDSLKNISKRGYPKLRKSDFDKCK